MNHIDLTSVLRGTVCDLYSNLVTRPTGAAVRTEIERALDALDAPALAVLDFTHVRVLDFSCADEIVAKLLLRYSDDTVPAGAYFVFRGIKERHLDPIETVLERRGLALVADERGDKTPHLVGAVENAERVAWDVVARRGKASPQEVAREADIDEKAAMEALEHLVRRRLLVRRGDEFATPLGPYGARV